MRLLKAFLVCTALVALLGGLTAFPAHAEDDLPPSHALLSTGIERRVSIALERRVSTALERRVSTGVERPVPSALSLLRTKALRPPMPAALAPAAACSYNASTAELLDGFSSSYWLDQVRALSGADPVILSSGTYTITTRYTPRLFDGSPNARAYDYVLDQLYLLHYPASSIEQDAWMGGGFSGMNLVLTIPGVITPTEVVALTAHLDSLSPPATVNTLAPGAEDNASGSAALLEAARLLRHYQFDRTLKLIWFTGEEQGLRGSTSYANDQNRDLSGYRGVVNLDMFGYDSDNDRCFELHVGTLPASNVVGQCYLESVQAYSLGLSSDYLTTGATGASDHYPFWQQDVGAVLVHQNGFNAGTVCGPVDHNPYYHTVNDTVANSFPPYTAGQPNTVGADIARAGLAAVAGMAGNRGACFSQAPDVTGHYTGGYYHLSWVPLSGAAEYRIYKQVNQGWPSLVYRGTDTAWTDYFVVVGWNNFYSVEAVAADGACQSQSTSNGLAFRIQPMAYLPVVKR